MILIGWNKNKKAEKKMQERRC